MLRRRCWHLINMGWLLAVLDKDWRCNAGGRLLLHLVHHEDCVHRLARLGRSIQRSFFRGKHRVTVEVRAGIAAAATASGAGSITVPSEMVCGPAVEALQNVAVRSEWVSLKAFALFSG